MRVLRTLLTVSLLASTLTMGSIAVVSVATSASAATQVGIDWTARTSAADIEWFSVVYGNGLFVAVAQTGTGNRVMTSPDGITWTSRTSAADASWHSVAFGNGLFVAVALSGQVMTSPDGITWTAQTSPSSFWRSVAYGDGLFVALSLVGPVMTSPDGIDWTSQTVSNSGLWYSVTYGNNRFVAVSHGTGVMTSPDGITWTTRTSELDNQWMSVVYGNNLFVAVAQSGTGNRVMTSPDGETWTSRTSAADLPWQSVAFGDGIFVAVAISGNDRVMTSSNGETWTSRTPAAGNNWQSVTYGNGAFVAVSSSGTGNRVMTSGEVFPNASHTVTYTVAPTRSISLERIDGAQTPGVGTTVAFGSLPKTAASAITQVRLKFTADDAIDENSGVRITAQIDTDTATGVTLEVGAAINTFPEGYFAQVSNGRVTLDTSAKNIITSIYGGASGVTDATSELTYGLGTSDALPEGPQTKTVTYTLRN